VAELAYSGGALDAIRAWRDAGWITLRPGGGVFELGAQEVNPDVPDDVIWSFVNAFYPAPGTDAELRAELADGAGGRCHMSSLLKAAGFRYLALDLAVRPGTVRFDLNCDKIDDDWRGAFDFTTSQGTLEHVVNQLHCLTIMHDVTAVGGTLLLNLPFAGSLNHGFFQYNPKFVVALALANNYQMLNIALSGPVYHEDFGNNFDIFDGDFHPAVDRITGSANWAGVKLPTGGYIVLLRKTREQEFRFPSDYGAGTFERLVALP
jgi:hypothetical protein